jgi:NADH-quinone oxidoreductase subunit L
VIHAMSDEQDMRKMGGLAKLIPVTCTVMWIGNLALAGIPPLAGSYSKDAIIAATYASGTGIGVYAFICTVLAAFLTAFYSWRLLFMTFHGTSRADHHVLEHAHESPAVMLAPLVVLALGAVFAGWALDSWFIGAGSEHFWNGAIFNGPNNHVVEQLEQVPGWVDLAPLVVGLAGIALAYVMYMANPLLPARLAARFGGIYRFLLNKWYFDELYDFLFVQPALRLARLLWQVGDATLIDGVPNGLVALTGDTSRQVVKIQTGSLAVYAFVMLIGVVVLVAIFMLSR